MRLSDFSAQHVIKARRNASRPALGAGKPLPINRPRFTNRVTGESY